MEKQKIINITEINELISKLTNEYDQSETNHILKLIPEDDEAFKQASFNKIKDNTSLSLKYIIKLYNKIHKSPKVKTDTKKKGLSIPQLNESINNLTDVTNQRDYDKILINIPENKPILHKTLFKAIAKKTEFTLKEIRTQYSELHKSPKVKTDTKKKRLTIDKLEANLKKNPKNKKSEYLKYNDKLIQITPSKIYLITLNKSGGYYPPVIMADFSLKILSKTIDYKNHKKTYYTFLVNKNLFYNYNILDFLDIHADKIYKGTLGRDVVKFIFNNPSKNIPEKKAKKTCGWKNRWYLIFIKDADFSLMWDTDEQKEVINNCRKIYKVYTQEEKEEIISMFKELIEITDMPKDYITIIVSWSIISVFKLYFIKHLNLFVHLFLSGKLTAGKSTFLDVFTTDFYKVNKKHTAGQTVKSVARFENISTASTFPRMIDQFENYSKAVVDVLKEMATSDSNYKRQTGVKHQISKPKVTPICATANNIGNHFKDPSDLSRAIILDYDKPIKDNPRWAELSNKLRKEKPFSLLYDYTNDWTNKDITKLIKEANETINIDKIIEKIEKANNGIIDIDINYPRIRKVYQIIVAGVYLFWKVFGIKLPLEKVNVFKTLLKLRRNVGEELLDRFIAFCRQAKDFTYIERPPSYLTVPLKYNQTDGYNFESTHLRDFNTFMRSFGKEVFDRKNLAEMLTETLTDKTLIKYTNRKKGYTKSTKVIVISEKLIGLPIPPDTHKEEDHKV